MNLNDGAYEFGDMPSNRQEWRYVWLCRTVWPYAMYGTECGVFGAIFIKN